MSDDPCITLWQPKLPRVKFFAGTPGERWLELVPGKRWGSDREAA